MNNKNITQKKLITNEIIQNINIITSYNFEIESDEKIIIKNMFSELLLIKNLFNFNNLIQILTLFKYTKYKKYNEIFLNIFYILKEDYLNDYDYLNIIFLLLKLYKNKYNILKITELHSFFISLKNYLLSLSTKSELIKSLLLLNKLEFDENNLLLLFSMLFKELSKYTDFNYIYNKLLDCVSISYFNIDMIHTNKKKIYSHYTEINNKLNELYDLENINKYKIDQTIVNYFQNVIININNINVLK